MADNKKDEKNILAGKISLKDEFTKILSDFTNKSNKSASDFDKNTNKMSQDYNRFTQAVLKGNSQMTQGSNEQSRVVDQLASKYIKAGNTVKDSLIKATQDVQKMQENSLNNLTRMYAKQGKSFSEAFSMANSDVKKNWGISGAVDNKENNSFSTSLLGILDNLKGGQGLGGVISSIGSMAGKFAVVGSAITAGIKIGEKMFQEYGNMSNNVINGLNKLSGGMLTADGFQEALTESMEYETTRMKLDLFEGDSSKGLERYQSATNIARSTFASEKDVADIASRLSMAEIEYDDKDLKSLVDIAGSRPEVPTEQIGLAIDEALEGNTRMLKNYGVTTNKLRQYLSELKTTDKEKYNQLKGAIDKKGSIKDTQKYFDLVVGWIQNSPIDGFAETYAQTVQGKLERTEGVLSNIKASMLGMDYETGTTIQGSLYDYFSKAVDDAADQLNSKDTNNMVKSIQQGLGSAAEEVYNAFSETLDNADYEAIGNMIGNIGESFGDFIRELKSSGQLDKIINELPTIVKQALKYKQLELEWDIKKMQWAEGFYTTLGKIEPFFEKIFDFAGIIGDSFFGEAEREIKALFGSSEETVKKTYSDSQIINMINSDSEISAAKKQDLKQLIKQDNNNEISIEINSNKTDIDSILKAIENKLRAEFKNSK